MDALEGLSHLSSRPESAEDFGTKIEAEIFPRAA
jgi:hypothetical protein